MPSFKLRPNRLILTKSFDVVNDVGLLDMPQAGIYVVLKKTNHTVRPCVVARFLSVNGHQVAVSPPLAIVQHPIVVFALDRRHP